MDLAALLDMIERQGGFASVLRTPLVQWGPQNRVLQGANLLPPRLVANSGREERVRFTTVAAVDGTPFSPAQRVGGGEKYGWVKWELGNSDILRDVTGPTYAAVKRYLNSNMDMAAAANVVGLFSTMIAQGLAEHDELTIWDAIVNGQYTQRGNNGMVKYVDTVTYENMSVEVTDTNWTSASGDPYASDIIPALARLVDNGFSPDGITCYTTNKTLLFLSEHPATAKRLVTAPLATGQTVTQATGLLAQGDVIRLLTTKLGVANVITYDLRIDTVTGSRRALPEGTMVFKAATGASEEIQYNYDNPADVLVVPDTVGFLGIGTPDAQSTAGRCYAVRAGDDEKVGGIIMKGWQVSGPVVVTPEALAVLKSIPVDSAIV